jgi:hypothetical protein
MPLAERIERRHHVVLLAAAGAPGRDDHVERARRLRQPCLHRLQIVGKHAEIGHHRSRAGDQRRQHRRVGIEHLSALECAAAPPHLVAGRDDGDL